ncbi:DUF3325 domain-containing protein [Roseococcus sp. YIM B11640]|uniref:DUF3325 domain-containing protein n=1 Tax=Roseococcus sp. YIM B11640 TaxID=3133973 RepID=UPI003C79BC77
MLLLGTSLAYAGFLALCLSLERHYRDVVGGRPSSRRVLALRVLGWALIALSAWPCVSVWGWAMGSVGWFGLLTAAALGLVYLLPYAPRLAAALGPTLPVLAGIAVFITRGMP